MLAVNRECPKDISNPQHDASNVSKDTNTQVGEMAEEHQANDSITNVWKTAFVSALKYLETCTDYMAKETSEIFEMLQAESIKEDTRAIRGDILADLEFGKLFVKMWQDIPSKNSLHQRQRLNMKRAYWNYTDLSAKLCLSLGKAGVLDLLLQELVNLEGSKAKQLNDHINTNLTILYNCARLCDENRAICRNFSSKENKSAIDILSGYLNDSCLVNKTVSLLTLAYIVEEDESEKLATTGTDGCLSFLVSLLEESLKYSNHRAESVLFTTEELLNGLNQLAQNDVNTVKMVQEGVVPLIATTLMDRYCEMEQVIAAQVLWRLAFVKSNRQAICENENAVQALKKLKTFAPIGIREACSGALWELFEGQVDLTQEDTTSVSRDPHSTDDDILHSRHLMISYQWDAQDRMMELKEKLTSAGYNVWMDVDKMEGNILATMAEAVENSEAILIGLSRKYKESTNCRTEASYAYKLKKPIIPLLVEMDYDPDGWLGALAGMLLYYRNYNDEVMSADYSSLVKEIGQKGMRLGNESDKIDHGSGSGLKTNPITAVKSSPNLAKKQTSLKSSKIVSWSKEQVQSWLDDKGLEEVKSEISSYCDGDHLHQMYRQFQRSPAFFESGLKDDLHLDFHVIIKFLTALEDLFSN